MSTEVTATSLGERLISAGRFLIPVLVLGAAAYLTALAIVLFVPDRNDYALASNLKHERLDSLSGPKAVLVGGSNLPYGIDSAQLQGEIGCPVINMGMNGYFGIRFMLEEVRPNVSEGDLVVIAFEWDNYFKSVDGTSTNLMGVAKANPETLAYMTWTQRARVVSSAAIYAARRKIVRLAGDLFALVGRPFAGTGGDEPLNVQDFSLSIEMLSGFNAEGDLESHLDVTWPFQFEQGIVTDDIETKAVDMIAGFVTDMEAKGVRVVISYTPVMAEYYKDHSDVLGQVHEMFNDALPAQVPSSPDRYVFEEPMFFDTVYHLNRAGRAERTQRLAEDITASLGQKPVCGTRANT